MSTHAVSTFTEVSELIDVVASFLAIPEGGDPLTFPRCWQALGTMRLVNSQWHAEATLRLWSTLASFVTSVPVQSARDGTWLARERRRFKYCLHSFSQPCELTFGDVSSSSRVRVAKELLNSEVGDDRTKLLETAIGTAKPLRSSLLAGEFVCFLDYLLLASSHAFRRMDHQDFLATGKNKAAVYNGTVPFDFGVVDLSLKPTDSRESGESFQQWTSSKVEKVSYIEDEIIEIFADPSVMAAYDPKTELCDVDTMNREFKSLQFKMRDEKNTPTFDTETITVPQAVYYLLEHFYL